MFGRHRKARVLFGLSDVLLAALAFESAYQTRVVLHLERAFYLTVERKALVLAFALAAWVTIGLWLEVYEKLDIGKPRVILRDAARQCGYGALCMIVFEYVFRLDLSRPFLILFSVYAWVLLLLFRLVAGRVVGVIRREFAAPHYVMVVGTGVRAVRMARGLEQSSEYGIRLRGFLSESADAPAEIQLRVLYKVLPIGDLHSILREHVVDEVILSLGSESVLLTFSAAPYDEIKLLLKRVTDIAIALAGLVVLAPLMAAIAILIRLTSPGPAIFQQVRCGLNGRLFLF